MFSVSVAYSDVFVKISTILPVSCQCLTDGFGGLGKCLIENVCINVLRSSGIAMTEMLYADYIVMKKDGTVWVIETKVGESHGQDKNIDKQIENKFNAFKKYATEKGLHWGFVRDKDSQLYINNTEFAFDMADEHWVLLASEF